MLVAEGRLSHIAELDGAFAAAVHEQIAVDRMELGSGNDLSELFHIYRLNVHNVYNKWIKSAIMGDRLDIF